MDKLPFQEWNTTEYDELKGESRKMRESMKGAMGPIFVLQVLQDFGPTHTYQIQQILGEKSSGQYATLVYPVVKKLEKIGCVCLIKRAITDENRAIKILGITEKGRVYLELLKSEYREMNQMFDFVLKELSELPKP